MVTITGDNPSRNAAFKQQLVDWYLHRVYEELDGPLTDAIAAIPPSSSPVRLKADTTYFSTWRPASAGPHPTVRGVRL